MAAGAFLSPVKENVIATVQDALIKTIAAEPIEKIIKTAKHDGQIEGYTTQEIAKSALAKKYYYDLNNLIFSCKQKKLVRK